MLKRKFLNKRSYDIGVPKCIEKFGQPLEVIGLLSIQKLLFENKSTQPPPLKTYIRTILQFYRNVCSPLVQEDIDRLESIQKYFTSRIGGTEN